MALSASPDQCAKDFAALLRSQADVCKQILEKSERQQTMVTERREDELLVLLADKQKLIDRHQALAGKAAPFRAQWEEGVREKASPAARADVEDAWNRLRETLDAVVRLEDASRAVLEEQKGKISLDIGLVQRGKAVNKAYGGAAAAVYRKVAAPPRYSDKQG
jgi:hypothetical protein